jgi:hypothetical protein
LRTIHDIARVTRWRNVLLAKPDEQFHLHSVPSEIPQQSTVTYQITARDPSSMMAKEKTFQFALTASECRLFRFLRELENDFEDEYPMIYDGTDPKLFVTNPVVYLLHN